MASDSSPISRLTGKPITPERVRELFAYDQETGLLSWRVTRGRFSCAGKPAGNRTPRGRINVKVDGRLVGAHRIIWAYMTGEWPGDEIDHRDGDPGNNRWINLREADRFQNTQNTKFERNNSSGHKGVSYRKDSGKWRARIGCRGVKVTLGVFATKEEAVAAYLIAATEKHGEWMRVCGRRVKVAA